MPLNFVIRIRIYEFLKDSTLRDGALFPQFDLFHWEKTDCFFMPILPEMYLWTRKFLLDFGSHLVRLGGGLGSSSVLVLCRVSIGSSSSTLR